MIAPLTNPINAPARRETPTPTRILPVAFSNIAHKTPEKATVEPTERSKSRDARQNIIVQDTIPICETDNASPSMLSMEKK